MSTLPTVKKGRVTRVTKVHEERDLVRVERDDGSGPVAEVLDHRQIRSSVAPARRKSKGKILATLPSSETETAAGPGGETSDVLDSQEAEELLSEAEKLLRQPVQGGTRHVTAEHSTQAGPSQQLELGSADDAVPDSQHHIEEVHPDTAEDGQQAEFEVEEPESSMAALSGSSGLLEARKHGAAAKGDATSKAQSPDKVSNLPGRSRAAPPQQFWVTDLVESGGRYRRWECDALQLSSYHIMQCSSSSCLFFSCGCSTFTGSLLMLCT